MKTSNYLWAVLATATLSLSACGSDENENVMQPKEKTAKLELTLVGAPADSRATGTLPTTDESQINRLTVAVFTERRVTLSMPCGNSQARISKTQRLVVER
ncbi:MAG: fimbrial protein [Bacteroides cellulosilyticus]